MDPYINQKTSIRLHVERDGIIWGLRRNGIGKIYRSCKAGILRIPVRQNRRMMLRRKAVKHRIKFKPRFGFLLIAIFPATIDSRNNIAQATFYRRKARLDHGLARRIANRMGPYKDALVHKHRQNIFLDGTRFRISINIKPDWIGNDNQRSLLLIFCLRESQVRTEFSRFFMPRKR